MAPTTDQPGKGPEIAPQVPEVKSADEKARLELEAKQKAETNQVSAEHAKGKAEAANASAAARADLMASTPTPSPTNSPNAAPNASPAASKSFSDSLKDFFGKFKDFFGAMGAKLSEFFNSIFKKKDQPTNAPAATNTPAPSPTSAPANAPTKSVETDKSSWRGLVESEAKRLGIDPAFALAIITVESGKSPFSNAPNPLEGLGNPPIIRFEPHVLNSQLSSKGINEKHGGWGASKLVGRNVDGVSCEGGQANEIACLRKAMSINRDAAFNSISMGMGQIMGFNAKGTGYASAEEMFKQFSSGGGGVNAQILGMFKLIENNKAHLQAARNKDFSRFSTLYNGASAGSSKHASYMAALQNAYRSNGGSSGGNMAVA